MFGIQIAPGVEEKLALLSQGSQYDLACSCNRKEDCSNHRKRSAGNRWIYPAALPSGKSVFLFKTLVSNVCENDCAYCPFRAERDVQRMALSPEETATAFLDYWRRGQVEGLFISSGVTGSPDAAMERLNATARILRRKKGFRGYIHLKILPGASDAAIEEAMSLASAVSINIETAGESHFKKLSRRKDYLKDIIRPLKLIGQWAAKGGRYAGVKATTQFVVGASTEQDREILDYSYGLYRRVGLTRVYFNAYQRGIGRGDLPGEQRQTDNGALLLREHRLYQADFLMRKYGFDAAEIPTEGDGALSLTEDPKAAWARCHPEFFPLNLNTADRWQLLRAPGLGPTCVQRILEIRKNGGRVQSLAVLGKKGIVKERLESYVRV